MGSTSDARQGQVDWFFALGDNTKKGGDYSPADLIRTLEGSAVPVAHILAGSRKSY